MTVAQASRGCTRCRAALCGFALWACDGEPPPFEGVGPGSSPSSSDAREIPDAAGSPMVTDSDPTSATVPSFRSASESFIPDAGPSAASSDCSLLELAPRTHEENGIVFEDVTEDHPDLAAVHSTPGLSWSSPDMYSGGALFRDLNDDGLADILIARTGQGDPDHQGLVMLRATKTGAFEQATAEAGLTDDGPTFALAAADFDGNGLTDIFVAAERAGDRLFFQSAPGLFQERGMEAGVVDPERPSRSVAVFDADLDGWLDLYVTAWNDAGPKGHQGGQDSWTAPNVLYRNLGDGTFEDLSDSVDVACYGRSTLGVAAADLDGDGDSELYVANDFFDDCLYENVGDGQFEDVSEAAGVGPHAINAMGVATGDADGDGDLDLFVSDDERPDLSPGNAFYENVGGLGFLSRAIELGLDGTLSVDQQVAVYWGTAFRDFDNDGTLDLHVAQQATGPDYIFQYDADAGRYFPVSQDRFDVRADSRGSAYADYDGDGRVDIFVVTRGGSPRLLHNVGAADTHVLRIAIAGPRGNSEAIGARLSVEACGELRVRHVEGSTGYLSAGETAITVGLGTCDEPVDVSVELPGIGSRRALAVPVDRQLSLRLDQAALPDCEFGG